MVSAGQFVEVRPSQRLATTSGTLLITGAYTDTLYYVCGNRPATWESIAAEFDSWALLAPLTWDDLLVGMTPIGDVLQMNITRRLGDRNRRLTIGEARLELDNFHGDYTPQSNDLVKPGRPLRIKAALDPSTAYSLFQGEIEEAALQPFIGRRRTQIRAADETRKLARTIQQPFRIDAPVSSLFTEVLSAAGIASEVDQILDTPPFASFDNIRAGEAVNRLVQMGSHFVFGRAGKIVVRNRNFDLAASSVGSYDEFLSMRYGFGDAMLANRARISGQVRQEAAEVQTVGFLQDKPTIARSQTISFEINYIDPDTRERNTPANSVVAPVPLTDYFLNTQANSLGTDLTSQALVVFTSFATTAVVTMTNNASQAAVLVGFQVRGFPVVKTPEFIATRQDSASIAEFGEHDFELRSDLIPSVLFAANYAAFVVDRGRSVLPDIDFRLKNVFPDVLRNDLLDQVSLVESSTLVNSAFVIDSVEHQIDLLRGLEHVAQYGIRLADTKNFLILDKDPEGKLDVRQLGF
jgi:hypothetical protein